MSGQLKFEALIELCLIGKRDVPSEYAGALKEDMPSDPARFYLPWPTRAIPAKGAEVFFSGLDVGLKAGEAEYRHSGKDGVTAYIPVKLAVPNFGIEILLNLAEAGFLTEGKLVPLSALFKSAGLAKTYQGYLENKKLEKAVLKREDVLSMRLEDFFSYERLRTRQIDVSKNLAAMLRHLRYKWPTVLSLCRMENGEAVAEEATYGVGARSIEIMEEALADAGLHFGYRS